MLGGGTVRCQAREAQWHRQEAVGQMRRRVQAERKAETEGEGGGEGLDVSVVCKVLGQWLPGQTGVGSPAGA